MSAIYIGPSFLKIDEKALKPIMHINCGKGSIGARGIGAVPGVKCSGNIGVVCSGVDGIGVACASEQTGSICADGNAPISCKNSSMPIQVKHANIFLETNESAKERSEKDLQEQPQEEDKEQPEENQ